MKFQTCDEAEAFEGVCVGEIGVEFFWSETGCQARMSYAFDEGGTEEQRGMVVATIGAALLELVKTTSLYLGHPLDLEDVS